MPSSPAEDDGSYYDDSEVAEDYARAYPTTDDAYMMGTDPTMDRARAAALMYDPASVIHEYDPSNWQGNVPSIATGNEEMIPPVVHTDQNWSNSSVPSLGYMAGAQYGPEQRFPYAEEGMISGYVITAGEHVEARMQQTLARTAYGPLDDVGQRLAQNPDDPHVQHASNVSVDAAFNVMATSSAFTRQDAVMRDHHRRTEADRKKKKRKEQSSHSSGNSQASGSQQRKKR
ncbi:hypothetical protein [Streptomyces sp. H23]|uniref:hypothetical protein n=1 Tax=Streptomyces sp. H23 TaxID=2541723 RepID=UPI00106E90F2|nr:hypothetical protein [Streptomyces sp. H23]